MSSEISPSAPEVQALHNRAFESTKETRQSIITLSTGAIGVFFLALTSTGEEKLNLSGYQMVAIAFALAFMAVAVFAGLWAAFSDAQWSYCWAKEREMEMGGGADEAGANTAGGVPGTAASKEDDWNAKRKIWHRRKRLSQGASMILFALGVSAALVYVILRSFDK